MPLLLPAAGGTDTSGHPSTAAGRSSEMGGVLPPWGGFTLPQAAPLSHRAQPWTGARVGVEMPH